MKEKAFVYSSLMPPLTMVNITELQSRRDARFLKVTQFFSASGGLNPWNMWMFLTNTYMWSALSDPHKKFLTHTKILVFYSHSQKEKKK